MTIMRSLDFELEASRPSNIMFMFCDLQKMCDVCSTLTINYSCLHVCIYFATGLAVQLSGSNPKTYSESQKRLHREPFKIYIFFEFYQNWSNLAPPSPKYVAKNFKSRHKSSLFQQYKFGNTQYSGLHPSYLTVSNIFIIKSMTLHRISLLCLLIYRFTLTINKIRSESRVERLCSCNHKVVSGVFISKSFFRKVNIMRNHSPVSVGLQSLVFPDLSELLARQS